MSHTKVIQFYRNNIIIRPNTQSGKSAFTVAKETLDEYGSKQDGEITLIRYKESDGDPVKTLAGVYHKMDNSNGTYTYLCEVDIDNYYTKTEIDNNERVISEALNYLESGKQDNINDISEIRTGAALGLTSIQQETDPTVPSWAKSATKPVYTSAEISTPLVDISSSGDVVQTISTGIYYRFSGDVSQLTLNLTPPNNGYLAEYFGKFHTSQNGCTLVLPSNITEAEGNPQSYDGSKTYEFHIADNVIRISVI